MPNHSLTRSNGFIVLFLIEHNFFYECLVITGICVLVCGISDDCIVLDFLQLLVYRKSIHWALIYMNIKSQWFDDDFS